MLAAAGRPSADSDVGQTDPISMRLMGSVHRLVLEGAAPELARFYPSVGGTDAGDPWPAFVETVEAHHDRLLELLDHPVQTNEVARCSALLSGFLPVARETGLPLRLLELGSSAGLLLRWPEYHYVEGEQTWGDPRSPVRLEGAYAAGRPPFDVAATVAERRGCDAAPLDPNSAEDRLTLMSFVWADEAWRFELLKAALDVAQRVPVTVEQADAVRLARGDAGGAGPRRGHGRLPLAVHPLPRRDSGERGSRRPSRRRAGGRPSAPRSRG